MLDATERYGRSGRVVAGHLTSLAAAPPAEAATRIRRLADAGVGVVSLPATYLHLGGRLVDYNRPRGPTPLRELLQAGVTVAVGTNNHQNAFTPYGGGGLLPIAWLAGLAGHFGSVTEQRSLLDLITVHPATRLGRPRAVVARARRRISWSSTPPSQSTPCAGRERSPTSSTAGG